MYQIYIKAGQYDIPVELAYRDYNSAFKEADRLSRKTGNKYFVKEIYVYDYNNK